MWLSILSRCIVWGVYHCQSLGFQDCRDASNIGSGRLRRAPVLRLEPSQMTGVAPRCMHICTSSTVPCFMYICAANACLYEQMTLCNALHMQSNASSASGTKLSMVFKTVMQVTNACTLSLCTRQCQTHKQTPWCRSWPIPALPITPSPVPMTMLPAVAASSKPKRL